MGGDEQYVSRAAYKLDSVAADFHLDFKNKVVLDVGSSTGGFSDYALTHGARLVIAVERGTNQIHSKLRLNNKLELHEKTDIRNFRPAEPIDIVLIDVSFISLREVLPYISTISSKATLIVAMVKPQFETTDEDIKNKGVIKNEKYRRQILAEFEKWIRPRYFIKAKADSKILGVKGNKERFYLLIKSK